MIGVLDLGHDFLWIRSLPVPNTNGMHGVLLYYSIHVIITISVHLIKSVIKYRYCRAKKHVLLGCW